MAAMLIWAILGLIVTTITVTCERFAEPVCDWIARMAAALIEAIDTDPDVVEYRKRKADREELRIFLAKLEERA